MVCEDSIQGKEIFNNVVRRGHKTKKYNFKNQNLSYTMYILLFPVAKLLYMAVVVLAIIIIKQIAEASRPKPAYEPIQFDTSTDISDGSVFKAPFVLYLRGFANDGKLREIPSKSAPGTKRQYLPPLSEKQLSKRLSEFGRFISLNNPSQDYFVHERVDVDSREWKFKMIRLLNRSSMIIFRPSDSEGILFEFRLIAEHNLLYKTIVYVSSPEDKREVYDRFLEKVKDIIPVMPDYTEDMFINFESAVKFTVSDSIEPAISRLLGQKETKKLKLARKQFINSQVKLAFLYTGICLLFGYIYNIPDHIFLPLIFTPVAIYLVYLLVKRNAAKKSISN